MRRYDRQPHRESPPEPLTPRHVFDELESLDFIVPSAIMPLKATVLDGLRAATPEHGKAESYTVQKGDTTEVGVAYDGVPSSLGSETGDDDRYIQVWVQVRRTSKPRSAKPSLLAASVTIINQQNFLITKLQFYNGETIKRQLRRRLLATTPIQFGMSYRSMVEAGYDHMKRVGSLPKARDKRPEYEALAAMRVIRAGLVNSEQTRLLAEQADRSIPDPTVVTTYTEPDYEHMAEIFDQDAPFQ